MIWTGYVCFNIARSEYLKQALNKSFGGTSDNDWESFINESIRSWMTSNKMISEYFSEKSWLQQAFISEENFVRLSKVVLQMKKKEPLTDYNGNPWISNYSDIISTPFYNSIPKKDPQMLTDSLLEDIKTLLNNSN